MTVEASMLEFTKNQRYGYKALFLTKTVKIILI